MQQIPLHKTWKYESYPAILAFLYVANLLVSISVEIGAEMAAWYLRFAVIVCWRVQEGPSTQKPKRAPPHTKESNFSLQMHDSRKSDRVISNF